MSRALALSGGPEMTPKQREKLARLLRGAPFVLMPYEIARFAGLRRDEAIAVMLAIGSSGELGKLFLNVYHGCEEHPVDVRPYGEGRIADTWTCPDCEEPATPRELTYELALEVSEPVDLK